MYLFASHISLFVFLLVPYVLVAQQDTIRVQLQDNIEEMLDYVDPENTTGNGEQLIQLLQELADHPVNINQATTEDLLRIPGINFKIARAVRDYRDEVKPFESVEELLEVKGIGKVTLAEIRPYVSVGHGWGLGKHLYSDYRYWSHGGRVQLYSRYQQDLQQPLGYLDPPDVGGYTGGPGKYYQRLGYHSNHLSLNITQEKDAGEPLRSPNGFDHNTWHVAIHDNGKLQMLVAGDYSLSFGQGLTLWNGGMFGKGSNVTGAVSRNGGGIRPYTSAREYGYQRGVAATVGKAFQATGFFSSRRHTASIISSDTTRFPRSDGYHRTLLEQSQENAVGQNTLGGRVQLALPVGVIGATGYRTEFDRYIASGSGVAAKYDFEGRKHSAVGVDYKILAGPAILFGEVGRSQNSGYGFISGLESSLGQETEIAIAYRNYQQQFQSLLGSGFGEQSGQPQNEEGLYLGIQHSPGDRLTFSTYMDQFEFPAPRFGLRQSSRGYEWLAKAELDLPQGMNAYLQVRSESKDDELEVSDLVGRTLRQSAPTLRRSIRVQLQHQVNKRVRLRTRGEFLQSRSSEEGKEVGYLLYQDVRVGLADPLTMDMRVSMFDTQSYATRIYQYENDLLNVFSSRALYNRGQRIYLLLHYKPTRFMECWAKFGVTVYDDQQVIGSGLNQIHGDTRSEIGVQARIRI